MGLGALFLAAAPTRAAAPVVDLFTATPATVAPGGLVDLAVKAHDPDCPGTCTTGCGMTLRSDLTLWSATGGTFETTDNGVTGSPYNASATWRAPATEATYSITVSLSDSGTFLCGGRQTTTASIDVQVTTILGQPPVIESLTANPIQLFPGESSDLTCRGTDPDGDPLTYSWDSDVGTVTPGAGGTAVFQHDTPGIASVTCTVTDSTGLFSSETIRLSVSSAMADRAFRAPLVTPQSVGVDSLGDVYVADAATRGITVINFFSRETVYHLSLPGVTSVTVDWNDDLVVGGSLGSQVVDRRGRVLLLLNPGEALGEVSAVAADPVRRRYAVLHRDPGRVVVYDEGGSVIGRFGSNGDAPEQFSVPEGLAITPEGDLLVADSGHGRIKVFDLAGNLLRSFGDLGGGAGEFVRLHGVAVTNSGLVYATDAFQGWVQVFAPDGTLLEVLGTFGNGLGEFKTPTGVAAAQALDRLLVASVNNGSVQAFLLGPAPPPPFPAPLATLSTTLLTFPDQPLGVTGGVRTVRLSNGGDAPLGLRRVSITGDFSQQNSCGQFLDPGQSCVFQIRFAPTAPGQRTGTLVLDTSVSPDPLTVSLVGGGFVPAGLAVSPPRLAFADQTIGTVSPPLSVTLTNPGTTPLTVKSIGSRGEFLHSSNCTTSLAGGASCTIEVRFAPVTASDAILGSLDIVTTGASGGTVRLFGAGVGRLLDPVPGVVSFGEVPPGEMSDMQMVTLANSGNLHVSVGSLAFEGEGADQFLIGADDCGGSLLAPGGACTFEVAFLPSREGETWARVAVLGDAFNAPAIELTGIGGLAAIPAIPTLHEWALSLLALLLAAYGLAVLRRRI